MKENCDIQWTMDRILYFRTVGKKEYTDRYRVQVFRKEVYGRDIFYLQVSGRPSVESVLQVKDEMQKALHRLLSLGRCREDYPPTYLVYEDGFEKWLESVRYEKEWRRLWSTPMYAEYHDKANLRQMLDAAFKKNGQSVAWPKVAFVLGYGPDMQEWLPWIAGHLRSLTFFVEFVTKGFEELLADMEEEFGLVAQVKLTSPGELRKQRLRSAEPVLVIDYSGNTVISVAGICQGSIWLDMDSIEAKRHNMEDRRTGITYLSLKNLWKREMSQTLDTIGNFEYNTEVKIDRLGG